MWSGLLRLLLHRGNVSDVVQCHFIYCLYSPYSEASRPFHVNLHWRTGRARRYNWSPPPVLANNLQQAGACASTTPQFFPPGVTPSPSNTPVPCSTSTNTATPTATATSTPLTGRIALLSDRADINAPPQIYLMSSDASSFYLVPNTMPANQGYYGDIYNPVQSPDGKQIAFWRDDLPRNGQNVSEIDIVHVDGSPYYCDSVTALSSATNRRIIAPAENGPITQTYFPAWSPDGKSIAFLESNSSGNSVAVVTNVDDAVDNVSACEQPGLPTVLYSSPLYDNTQLEVMEVAWSPDSQTLYAVARSTTAGVGLYSLQPNGSSGQILQLITAPFPPLSATPTGSSSVYYTDSVAVSPDGQYLAFTAEISTANPYIADNEIFVVPVSGGTPQQVTNFNANVDFSSSNSAYSIVRNITWSPDGSQLVFDIEPNAHQPTPVPSFTPAPQQIGIHPPSASRTPSARGTKPGIRPYSVNGVYNGTSQIGYIAFAGLNNISPVQSYTLLTTDLIHDYSAPNYLPLPLPSASTGTPTATAPPTNTPMPTATSTPTATATNTATPTLTPSYTATPTSTSSPLPTATNTPAGCQVTGVLSDGGVKYRSKPVPTPHTDTSTILYIVTNAGSLGMNAQQFEQGTGPVGPNIPINSIIVTQWIGILPSAPPDQSFEWVQTTMMLNIGQSVNGAMAYSDGNGAEALLLRLSCDPSRIPGYPTPVPTLTPTPNPTVYISCYKYGIIALGKDLTPTNVRLATNTNLVKSITVGQPIRLIGYATDPSVQALIDTPVLGGRLQPPPDLSHLPSNPPEIRNVGFALIVWDDNDPSTLLNWWWIIGTVLKPVSDCGNTLPSPTLALPPATVTSVYAPIYSQQAPLYATVPSNINPSGENPPALMGNAGVHPSGAGLTVDTVPLNVEQCVDAGICNSTALYNPNDRIGLYAPITGCVLGGPSYIPAFPSTITLIKEDSPTQCANRPNPQLLISFTHLDTADLASRHYESGIFVHQGDLIGYLCAQNNPSNCSLDNNPTHMAIGLSSYDTRNNPPRTEATIDQLLGLLPRLHDCFPKGLRSGGVAIPPTYVHNDLCSVFFKG